MSAYVIGRIEVTDPDQYKKYTARTPDVIAKFGGKFIVRGAEVHTLEGPEEKSRVAVIEFPSLEKAKAFYHSEEYVETRALRRGAAVVSLIAIEGV
jgi:uncharacterized protein (DUF1330 family)